MNAEFVPDIPFVTGDSQKNFRELRSHHLFFYLMKEIEEGADNNGQ